MNIMKIMQNLDIARNLSLVQYGRSGIENDAQLPLGSIRMLAAINSILMY